MKWNTVGFANIKEYFDTVAGDNSLAHAYLFFGQDMIGKRTLAVEIARRINGDAPQAGYLNIISSDRISGTRSIGIEKAREIKRFLSATPLAGSKNVVIVDGAQDLTEEAANAILKILEEPPASSLIFLTARVPDLLPATILSRCVPLYCCPQSKKEMESEIEKSGLSKSQNDFLLAYANGRLGMLKNLLECREFKSIKENVAKLAALIDGDINERLAWSAVTAGSATRDEVENLILSWLAYIRFNQQKRFWDIAPELMRLLSVIREPQYNMQIMIDGFVSSLPRH